MITTETGPELVSADQVAEELGISRAKVYQMAISGEIPAIKLGRLVRFSQRAIVNWLNQQSGLEPNGGLLEAANAR